MPELVSGRSAHAWRRACARGAAWLFDVVRASRWTLGDDPLDAAGFSRPLFGTVLGELSALACEPARMDEPTEEAHASRPATARPPAGQRGAGDAAHAQARNAARRVRSAAAAAAPGDDERTAHLARPVRARTVVPRPSRERAGDDDFASSRGGAWGAAARRRSRPPSAAMRTVSRARLAALAGDASRAPSFDVSVTPERPRSNADAANAIANAVAVRRRDAVAMVPADAVAAHRALADRLARRAARVMAAGAAPHARNGLHAAPVPSGAVSRATRVAYEPGDPGVVGTLVAGWHRSIAPSDVVFERAVPPAAVRERTAGAPPPAAPSASARERAAGPPAPAPEPRAPAAAYPPRDVLAPTAARNAAAETDPVRVAPPAVHAPLTALTPLRTRRAFPFPAAAPLSVAESVEEERSAFDPVMFAEQVRAALVNDARRHGIDV